MSMDKNRLLTDEEFIKLRPAFAGVDKIVLQAQDLKSVKAVIEWGNGPCPHGVGDFHDKDRPVTMCLRHACDQCWQELKGTL